MTLPASGQIDLNSVNIELGFAGTAQISLNDTAVRNLAGIPSGAISLNDLHGARFWARPSTYSTSGSGGTVSNASYVYDTSGTNIDTVTDAVINNPSGAAYSWPKTFSVTYSGFGSVTKSGTLYVSISGTLYDSGVTAYSYADLQVNGTSVPYSPVYSVTGGGGGGFSFVGGSAYTVSLTNQNLATLNVTLATSAGTVGPLSDGDYATANVLFYDLVFLGN